MQLRHYQHGPCAVRGEPEPSPGGVYAFMSPLEDPISRELELNGITPPPITGHSPPNGGLALAVLLSNEV